MTRLSLVEDDAAPAEALSRALRGLGHGVAVAATDEQALEARGSGGRPPTWCCSRSR